MKTNTDMSGTTSATVDAKIQKYIGSHLSSYYGKLVNEPIPDQLLKLLADLKQRERGS